PGLDAASPIGSIAEASPLFLREPELADPERRRAVAVELRAAGYSHCAVVDAGARFLRAVPCEELLGAAGGPQPAAAGGVQRVLVIGGAGYLGAVLVAELRVAGCAGGGVGHCIQWDWALA